MMRWLRTPRFWAGCVAGWMLLALVEGTALHSDAVRAGRPSQLGAVLFDRAISDLVWVAVAGVVFAAMERAMASVARAPDIAVRFAVLGLALAPVCTSWGPAARTIVHGGGLAGLDDAVRGTAGTTLIWIGFLYTMVTLTARMVLLSQRSRCHERDSMELRERLAHAELELLRAQLEPHFLFNALNTIAGLIRLARPELATTALAKLSQLLRYVVEASRQDRVPLAWELEFVTSYLELQQMRFGPRLQFTIHQTAAGRACDVPPLLLQPLIENAVVHGVARTTDPVTISVHIAMTGGELRVEVDNTCDERRDVAGTGDGVAGGSPYRGENLPCGIDARSDIAEILPCEIDGVPADRESTGVGLRNTRQRLERMYGDGFVLDAGPEGPDRYRVTIALPHVAAYA